MFEIVIGGIRCRCSLLFPAVLLLLLLLDRTGMMSFGVLAAFVHEMGHVMAMVLCKSRPKDIIVSFYGIRIVWDDVNVSRLAMTFVEAAGPMMNFLCAALSVGVAPMYASLHLALGLINLLPVFPLDGGHLLRSCGFGYVGRAIEMVFLVMLLALGVAVALNEPYNPTLLIMGIYVLGMNVFYKGNCNV